MTMWHSLEHVHHPLAILRAAYRLLIPGGKLIVATPNIESIPFRVFGRSWFGLDLPRHLTHFTPTTLGAMLQTAGFPNGTRAANAAQRLAPLQRETRAPPGHGRLRAQVLGWKLPAKITAWMCYAVQASDCMICVAQRPA